MSGQINLPWGDMWMFYKQAPLAVKVDILDQLDLDKFMAVASTKTRKEVLLDAPQDVVSRYTVVNREQAFSRIERLLQNRR
jgi:hypothetical protein